MKKRAAWIVVGMATVVNVALLVGLFYQPGDIFTDKPIATADFTFHYHFVRMGRASLQEASAVWGWDQTFMAGALFTPAFSSNYILKLTSWALPFLSVALIIKLVFLAGMGVIPLLIYLSAKNMGHEGPVPAVAGVLACVYIWSGLPLEIARYGMFLHVVGAAWAVFVFSWLARLLETGEGKAGMGLVLSAALFLAIHLASPIGIGMAVLAAFAMYPKKMDRKRWLWAGAAVVVAIMFALPWLGAFIKFMGLRTSSANDLQTPRLFELWVLLRTGHAGFEALVWLFGGIGFYRWRQIEPARRWVPVAACVAFLSVLYLMGGVSELLAQMTPRRLAVPLYMLFIVPAAAGTVYAAGRLREKLAGWKTIAAWAAVLLIMTPLLWINGRSVAGAMGSIHTGVPMGARSLIEWMENSTDNSGRIMIEDSVFTPLPGLADGMNFLGIIPKDLDRQFVGGPFPYTYIKPHVVSFQDGELLEKPIKSYDEASLKRVLIDFNIKWVVCHSRAAVEAFNAVPEVLTPVGSIGVFILWEVKIPTGGYFIRGSGNVSVGHNKINVTGAIPEKGELTLKYQWMPCMKVKPSGEVKRVEVPGEPVGFIGVTGAPSDFTIAPDYSHPWFPKCAAGI